MMSPDFGVEVASAGRAAFETGFMRPTEFPRLTMAHPGRDKGRVRAGQRRDETTAVTVPMISAAPAIFAELREDHGSQNLAVWDSLCNMPRFARALRSSCPRLSAPTPCAR
jgi:hypothetical protein